MIYVTRKEHFNAAHRLYNPNWSEEKNQEVFGPCANINFHGHNFELIVTVKGKPDPETGFVIDLKVLGDLIKNGVLRNFRHRDMEYPGTGNQRKSPQRQPALHQAHRNPQEFCGILRGGSLVMIE
jgi:hypothetical protein